MQKRLTIKISGHVQGIFFRYSAQENAGKLDIKVFARNETDGSVHIEAEGSEKNLKEFLEWCHQGPTASRVETVHVEEGELVNFTDFSVR